MQTPTRLLYPILVLAGILVTGLSLFSMSTRASELVQANTVVSEKQHQPTTLNDLYVRYGEVTNEERKQLRMARQGSSKSHPCVDCGMAQTSRAAEGVWR